LRRLVPVICEEIDKALEAAEADDELSAKQVKEMILKCLR